MKILIRGKLEKRYDWEGAYLCVHCRSVLKLKAEDAADVKSWNDDQRDGPSVVIWCPVCEQERTLTWLKSTTTYLDNRAYFDEMMTILPL